MSSTGGSWTELSSRMRAWRGVEQAQPSVRAMTFNILSPQYASQNYYQYTKPEVLDPQYRRRLVLKDIMTHQPHIVALQELGRTDFDKFFDVELKSAGYAGFHSEKSPGDGLGLFWRVQPGHDGVTVSCTTPKKFILKRLLKTAMEINHVHLFGQSPLTLLLRDLDCYPTIAQIGTMHVNFPGAQEETKLTVCNTHIHWDPKVPEIKACQMAILCDHLASLTPRPLLLMGDFNSLPSKERSDEYDFVAESPLISGVYELGTKGSLSSTHPHHPISRRPTLKKWFERNAMSLHKFPAITFSHSLGLGSAYNDAMGREPIVTNYTADFKGAIDYIFYSKNNLKVDRVLDVMDQSWLSKETALPNSEWPSDHISLVADFSFMSSPPY